MFRHTFQGGPYVEVFNPVNKELYLSWTTSKHVTKDYDKTAKTVVCHLRGDSTGQQMSLPKDKTKPLGLTQHYLVLQMFSLEKQRFSLDVRISCKSGCHKRVTFLSHKQDIQITPLFTAVPLNFQSHTKWSHIVIDFQTVLSEIWQEEFKSIDLLTINGSCDLRQIYTVHQSLVEPSDCRSWESRYMELLPKQCKFPLKVPQAFHLIGKMFIRCSINANKTAKGSGIISRADSEADKRSTSSNSTRSSKTSVRKAPSSSKFLRPNLSISSQRLIASDEGSSQAPITIHVTSEPSESGIHMDPQCKHYAGSPSNACSTSAISTHDDKFATCVKIAESSSRISLDHHQEEGDVQIDDVTKYFSHYKIPQASNSIPSINLQSSSRCNLIDGQAHENIAGLFPRHRNHHVWIPQLSPVSNAMSLAKAISSRQGSAEKVDSSPSRSVEDLFKEYIDKDQFDRYSLSTSSLLSNRNDDKGTFTKFDEQPSISPVPQGIEEDLFETLSFSNWKDRPSGLFQSRSSSNLNSTYSLSPVAD